MSYRELQKLTPAKSNASVAFPTRLQCDLPKRAMEEASSLPTTQDLTYAATVDIVLAFASPGC